MDIFSKLNTLKSIEPSESWVIETRKRVLSEIPVFERENILENTIDKKTDLGFNIQNLFQNLTFKKLMVPAFSLFFVLSTGVFTVGASKSSLPGDLLYSIKIINEDMALAVAPEDKKATIEMEHAGKRLEEIAEISKKTSDIEQQEKIGQLIERFEEKVESANNNLTKINKSGEKKKIAKNINTQSEKYTEVLAKTVEDFPTVIKQSISEEVAKAIDSSEKIYLTSLAVIVEEEEMASDIEEVQDDSVKEGEETTITEDDEKESDDLNNEGDVLGVEDNIEENDSEDIVIEEILDEIEEAVIKEEVDGEIN